MEKTDELSREHFYLAGMLHDIGKFLLRAEKESAAPDQNCRYSNGSYDFINQIRSELNKVRKNNSDVEN